MNIDDLRDLELVSVVPGKPPKAGYKQQSIDVASIRPENLYTLKDAGLILGLGLSQMKKLHMAHKIRCDYAFGARRFVSGAEILRYIETGKTDRWQKEKVK